MGSFRAFFSSFYQKLDRLISGSPSNDPLHLSNRTWDQVAKKWLLIFLVLGTATGATFLWLKYFGPVRAPEKEMSAVDLANLNLPQLNEKIVLPTNRELDTADVHVDHAKGRLVGFIKNTTERDVTGEVVFSVVESNLSQVGVVTVHVNNVAPRSSVPFSEPVPQSNAVFAIVREVRTK